MPNHFHLLLQQKSDGGAQKFMTDALNSFTRFYNIKSQRTGPLFLPRFKSVFVKRDEQLMHVSRYIHLNPYSGNLIKNKEDLITFPNSSYRFYISKELSSIVNTGPVMQLFNYDVKNYESFVMQNADYQQNLEHLKHTYKWR
jgi:putative transposase